jgi:hypothetical protein
MKLRWQWSSERGLWLVRLAGMHGELPYVVFPYQGNRFIEEVLAGRVSKCFSLTEAIQ